MNKRVGSKLSVPSSEHVERQLCCGADEREHCRRRQQETRLASECSIATDDSSSVGAQGPRRIVNTKRISALACQEEGHLHVVRHERRRFAHGTNVRNHCLTFNKVSITLPKMGDALDYAGRSRTPATATYSSCEAGLRPHSHWCVCQEA